MAKKLGSDYRLWIESATPGTYYMIAGNTTLSINRSSQTIDTSSKDDYPWGTKAPGMQDLQIQCEFVPNLPDANGYGRLETQANLTTATATKFQIRKNGSSGADPADVVLAGSFYIDGLPTSLNNNEPVKVSCTLSAASAPTTYALA